jgi:Mrp family chromosome partitioning ATPase
MQQLASVGARVVGAVLNDPDAKVQHYGGYYNYEYAHDVS